MVRFEIAQWMSDLVCPQCQSQLSANWSTEYGDALPGDHTATCPKCGKQISFDVEVTTTYTINPR